MRSYSGVLCVWGCFRLCSFGVGYGRSFLGDVWRLGATQCPFRIGLLTSAARPAPCSTARPLAESRFGDIPADVILDLETPGVATGGVAFTDVAGVTAATVGLTLWEVTGR